jgi:hypothetical protein
MCSGVKLQASTLVPLDVPRKDLNFLIFKELFVFVTDSSVYSCIHHWEVDLNWFTKKPAGS